MSSPNIRDLLTCFSPCSNFFAIASSDGRIKIWDRLKGQLQTEFTDVTSSDALGFRSENGRGHLSFDYQCMNWMPLESKKKKKKKIGSSLLLLGTGNGDALALDVSLGQLRWQVSDCHPGGVTAISFSGHNSCVYTAGVDGMVCQIDSKTGSLLGKFRSSTRAISALSISSDGKVLATAAAQLKIFNCSDNKKIQKFSGHPVAVRCLIFSEDGKYILSSAIGEKYIAVWRIDDSKKQSASCVLSMDHPAIFLDCKGSETEGTAGGGFYVMAISERGLYYFWYGRNIEELRNCRPTKISSSIDSSLLKNKKNMGIFAAMFHGIPSPAFISVCVVHGALIKPSFEELTVKYGLDMNLDNPQDGFLLPMGHYISQKGQGNQTEVTALDRANAEEAMLPLPKLWGLDKKRKHSVSHLIADVEETVDPVHSNRTSRTGVHSQNMEEDCICVEDRLRAVGILGSKNNLALGSSLTSPTNNAIDTTMHNSAYFLVDADMPKRKIRSHILSISPSDAFKLLEILVSSWETRSISPKHVLPWIYYILVIHGQFIISQESSVQMVDALHEMTRLKCAAIQPLLQLSGRLRLIMTQINKAGHNMVQDPSDKHHAYESEEEDKDEDEDIDELVYSKEENESLSGTDDDS